MAHMMGMEGSQVQIIQTTTGGGFGGKEDFPSLLACQVAVAALKAGHPVQVIFNRREDMAVTTKRHPARLHYRAALDENGNLTALDTEIDLDGGAYEGLSSVVLQRALIAAAGVYRLKGLQVHGRVMETNTVPTGAFRGFGAPQSFFGVELLMEHLARFTSRDSLSYRLSHMVEQFDPTATRGEFRYPIIMTQMVERVLTLSDYEKKKALYADQRGRYRRGIGISLFLHGCGFTGSAEKDFIRSVLRLARYEDDTYEILASNTDMGQGLKTTFSKIAAQVLEVPISRIRIVNPDTDRVPNSGPTVASRSLMVVGKLVERAARQMKEEEQPGKAHMVEVHYQHPDMIPWELSTFTGDAGGLGGI